jgi:ComF family protein
MPLPALLSLRLQAARLLAAVPSCCALCGCSGRTALCADCRQRYLCAAMPRCRRCAVTLPTGAASPLCGACLRKAPAFDAAVVAADYRAPLDQLVLALKFGGQLAVAPLLGQLLADAMRQVPAHDWPGILAPVPLGRRRLVERGFNQALEIARPLARSLGLRLAPTLLARSRETAPQTLLTPVERRANLRQAFKVPQASMHLVRGQHVGVVDDVLTTGATLDEVAGTLKRCGAVRITILAFARTGRG